MPRNNNIWLASAAAAVLLLTGAATMVAAQHSQPPPPNVTYTNHDAVPFELGEARARHMAARDRVRRWQAMLQTFYLLQMALLQARYGG